MCPPAPEQAPESRNPSAQPGQAPAGVPPAAPAPGSPPGPSPLTRAGQDRRRRQVGQVPVEDCLEDYLALGGIPQGVPALIYGDFLLRDARGEAPSPEEYLRRFP